MIAPAKNDHNRRSDKLLSLVEPYQRVAIIMHDNPDPDAIASGWAIKYLIESSMDKPVEFVGGGDIVQPENRHMVKLLRPPMKLQDDLCIDADTATILVDCGPEATNHLMSELRRSPVAVIDHHQKLPQQHGQKRHREQAIATSLLDIRPKVAASATIASAYLREQDLQPSRELATALHYALRTETRGSETFYSRLDQSILAWLTRFSDPSLIAEIESAPLSPHYYGDLALALQSTAIYRDAAFCILPRAECPEIIGEVADLLVRHEQVSRVLCAAVMGDSVLLSVRTDTRGGNATDLLLETIRGIGRGGGHMHRAGGKLTATTASGTVPRDVQTELRTRWLRACRVTEHDEARLLTRSQIIDNL